MPYRFRQGDVLLVPFPFTDDLTQTKQRPVVVLSRSRSNQYQFIAAKITSVLRWDAFAFMLHPTDLDFALAKPSEVRTNELFTLHESIARKKLGALTPEATERLLAAVQEHISFEG